MKRLKIELKEYKPGNKQYLISKIKQFAVLYAQAMARPANPFPSCSNMSFTVPEWQVFLCNKAEPKLLLVFWCKLLPCFTALPTIPHSSHPHKLLLPFCTSSPVGLLGISHLLLLLGALLYYALLPILANLSNTVNSSCLCMEFVSFTIPGFLESKQMSSRLVTVFTGSDLWKPKWNCRLIKTMFQVHS